MEYISFYVYAASIKVALIGAGSLAVLLGFRLFVFGIGDGSGGDISADGTKLTLSFANAAPGTVFGLFGAGIIASVAWNAAPALEITNTKKGGDSEHIRLRGSADAGAESDLSSHVEALSNPERTLQQAAPEFAAIAKILVDRGRNTDGKVYAQIAMTIDPVNAEAATAQAIALARLGLCNEAKELVGYLRGLGAPLQEKVETEIDNECS